MSFDSISSENRSFRRFSPYRTSSAIRWWFFICGSSVGLGSFQSECGEFERGKHIELWTVHVYSLSLHQIGILSQNTEWSEEVDGDSVSGAFALLLCVVGSKFRFSVEHTSLHASSIFTTSIDWICIIRTIFIYFDFFISPRVCMYDRCNGENVEESRRTRASGWTILVNIDVGGSGRKGDPLQTVSFGHTLCDSN